MKTYSLKKLRGLALPRHEKRDRHVQQSIDELSQASQDMQDMKECYDSLLSAAAATTNSVYEFSESLREMGDCLLEKTALNDDEESGKVLLMLGKVQFKIQDIVDSYRSHISQTIAIPSESLLNELRIVEDMKRQCDDKRTVYEEMIPKCRGKGRLRSSKGECVSIHELQAARDEYDEDASLFVFRMKSLKRGQSRSLLTQAARHHAAQMCFFRKALKSLEAIEPHVKFVTEQQHIEYHFSGLEDDDEDENDDNSNLNIDDDSEAHDDSELSFDYGQHDQVQDVSTSRNSMELDNEEITFSNVSTADAVKENSPRNPDGNILISGSSKSAPLLAGKDSDPAEWLRPMRQSSTRKFYTYVLPRPDETKTPVSSRLDTQVPQTRLTSTSGGTLNMWHSSPLEHKKYENTIGNEKFSGPIVLNTQSVLKDSNINKASSRLPPPLTEGLSMQLDQHAVIKKVKRQAFSGPLAGKSWSNKPNLSASGPIVSTGNPQLLSGSLLRTPLPRPTSSPKLSSSASPAFMSSPKINELHELPRPPAHLASKRPTGLMHHSEPLVTKGQELFTANKLMASNSVSTLPIPPQTVHRSYSIPSRDHREMELHVPKKNEASQNFKMAEDVASPPLTPIFLPNS